MEKLIKLTPKGLRVAEALSKDMSDEEKQEFNSFVGKGLVDNMVEGNLALPCWLVVWQDEIFVFHVLETLRVYVEGLGKGTPDRIYEVKQCDAAQMVVACKSTVGEA